MSRWLHGIDLVGTVIRRKSADEITRIARRVITDKLIIVDFERYPDQWRTSLLLMADHLSQVRNLGAVLVPVAPHLRGYWLSGIVPGITLECELVAKGDVPALAREIERMHAALFPEPP